MQAIVEIERNKIIYVHSSIKEICQRKAGYRTGLLNQLLNGEVRGKALKSGKAILQLSNSI